MTLLLLMMVGGFGLFAHWLKRWSRGQTKASFYDYMSGHRKYSIASTTTLLSSIAGMYVIGDVEITNQTIATAFLAGYAIDSTLNKAPGDK